MERITEDQALAEIEAALFPELAEVYDGPGALTAAEMVDKVEGVVSAATAARRARQAVRRGELVEVVVWRADRIGRRKLVAAWVARRVYEASAGGNDVANAISVV